ncbi:MAG: hypothetical protein QG622_3455 [Actinomycetota bacterium]|nr:hypothetical protein [Actinomycetota bacterium]
MRIAVARADGAEENAHFGYAERFSIYDVNDTGTHLVDERDATGHCLGHGGDQALLHRSVALVADCVAVVALRIGPCARRALDAEGVLALEHPGPGLAGADTLVTRPRREPRQELQEERSQ